MKRIFYILSILTSLSANAQLGQTVYNFLNIPVSPRQAALGGDVISLHDYDPNMSAVNPSLMNLEMDNRVSANYSSYLADSKLGSINYVKDMEYGHLISVNLRYMDFGKIDRTDEFGNALGSFTAQDIALGMGYAYQFEDDWTIGGQVNFISSKIDHYTSTALTGTAGITYHNQQSKEVLSLVFRNFGGQLKTYDGKRETLPFRIDLGYTKTMANFPLAISVTAHDLQKFDISSPTNLNGQKTTSLKKVLDHFSFGAEFFPEQAFNIRLGYNVKRGSDLAVADQRNFSGLSAGFGLKISWLKFDYSHVRYHNASNMNYLGLSLDLYELTGIRR